MGLVCAVFPAGFGFAVRPGDFAVFVGAAVFAAGLLFPTRTLGSVGSLIPVGLELIETIVFQREIRILLKDFIPFELCGRIIFLLLFHDISQL